MTEFRSKFVYPVFFVRLVVFLFLVTGVIMVVVIGLPNAWKKHPPAQAIVSILLGLLLFTYLLYIFGKSFLTQRFIIVIKNETVCLKDIIFRKSISLDDSFKGYSYSSYGDSSAFKDYKTLLFYFHDGRIIEFPQFLFTNFKHIHEALLNAKMIFLGNEPYIWKNLISRVYHFK
jgi:hypothetical protein